MAVIADREGSEAGRSSSWRTQKLENVYLRMGVKGGGCSGLSYSLEFDNEIGPHDKKFDIDGVPVVVRRQELSLPERHHARLRDGGADRAGFTFVNPQREIELWLRDIVLGLGPDGRSVERRDPTGETRRTGPGRARSSF